jgi:hypothetical protein
MHLNAIPPELPEPPVIRWTPARKAAVLLALAAFRFGGS